MAQGVDVSAGLAVTGDGGRDLRLWKVDVAKGDDGVLEAVGRARRIGKSSEEKSSSEEKEGSLIPDPETKLVHLQDQNGWHCKLGYYGEKNEHNRIMWHSAYGGPRITLGFVVFDEHIWEDIVEEITAAE